MLTVFVVCDLVGQYTCFLQLDWSYPTGDGIIYSKDPLQIFQSVDGLSKALYHEEKYCKKQLCIALGENVNDSQHCNELIVNTNQNLYSKEWKRKWM